MNKTLPLETIVSEIAGLGVPGLILATAIAATGLSGGAAIVAALAALGPGGMVGGIVTLLLSGVLVRGFTQFGTELILSEVVKELLRRGYSKESLKKQVSDYWISDALKHRLFEVIDQS